MKEISDQRYLKFNRKGRNGREGISKGRRENSLMLHSRGNISGSFDCTLPPPPVALAQDDRRTEVSEMLNCFCSTFRQLESKVLIVFTLLCVVPAFAAGRVQCASLTSHYVPSPVGYCALLPPSYDSQPAKKYPVLYFLHGLGGDHTFLVNSGAWSIIEEEQEEKRIGELV